MDVIQLADAASSSNDFRLCLNEDNINGTCKHDNENAYRLFNKLTKKFGYTIEDEHFSEMFINKGWSVNIIINYFAGLMLL